MKSINKLLTVLILALPVVSCSKEDNSKFTEKKALNELDNFFNADYGAFDLDLVLQGKITRLISFYNDDEKVIQTYPSNESGYSIKEIATKDKAYFKGPNLQVCTDKDNSELFVPNTYVDYKKLIKKTEFVGESRLLKFRMNLKDVTNSALNNETAMESLEETMKTLGVEFDLTNVPFEAYYSDKGLSTLSMVFDDFFKGHYGTLGSIKMSFKYRNISYGENLEKKEFDFSNFTSVANTYYELAVLAETDQYSGGTGLQFYSYSPDEPFKDQVPSDFLVGRLEIRAASFSRAIYFRDLTYNEITRMYEFKFLGKKFSWNEKIEIAKSRVRESILACDLSYELNGYDFPFNPAYIQDYDNNRILLQSKDTVKVFDINTLNVVKEYKVEGTINRIMCHKDVYHITTTTVLAESSTYDDYECYGNIYVIDKNDLDVKATYTDLNCSPYYTVIDKRGDIAISPSCGQGSWMAIYHSSTNTLERLEKPAALGGFGELYKQCYLTYVEEDDTIMGVETHLSGAKPYFFVYQNGKYIFRDHREYKGDTLPSGEVLLSYKGVLAYKNKIVDVNDWENPNSMNNWGEIGSYTYDSLKVAFADGNHIYWVQSRGSSNHTLIVVYNLETKTFEEQRYIFDESYKNISFGFIREGKFYLFDSALKQFNIYSVN